MGNYLLIKTPDNREFYTKQKHISYLTDFIKNFNLKFKVVQADKVNLLTLDELAVAICDKDYKPSKSMQQKTHPVKNFIKEQFLLQKQVTLKDIKKKYPDIRHTTLCSHFFQVRQELKKSGYNIHKISVGVYSL
jgi:protein associated with RNAse G/E